MRGQEDASQAQPLEGDFLPGLPSELGLADDPDGGERLFIGLTGAAAQWLFEQMAAQPERNECIGGMSKSGPNASHCVLYDDGSHACNLAIDPATDVLDDALAC